MNRNFRSNVFSSLDETAPLPSFQEAFGSISSLARRFEGWGAVTAVTNVENSVVLEEHEYEIVQEVSNPNIIQSTNEENSTKFEFENVNLEVESRKRNDSLSQTQFRPSRGVKRSPASKIHHKCQKKVTFRKASDLPSHEHSKLCTIDAEALESGDAESKKNLHESLIEKMKPKLGFRGRKRVSSHKAHESHIRSKLCTNDAGVLESADTESEKNLHERLIVKKIPKRGFRGFPSVESNYPSTSQVQLEDSDSDEYDVDDLESDFRQISTGSDISYLEPNNSNPGNNLKKKSPKRKRECLYVCPACDKVLKTSVYDSRHICTKKGFICRATNCRKRYRSRLDLQAHIQMEHIKSGSNQYACVVCETFLSSKSSYVRHLKTMHLKLGFFTCDTCKKQFRRKSTLIQHVFEVHIPPEELLSSSTS